MVNEHEDEDKAIAIYLQKEKIKNVRRPTVEKAARFVAEGCVTRGTLSGDYQVASGTNTYPVKQDGGVWRCSCKAAGFDLMCSHIIAAMWLDKTGRDS